MGRTLSSSRASSSEPLVRRPTTARPPARRLLAYSRRPTTAYSPTPALPPPPTPAPHRCRRRRRRPHFTLTSGSVHGTSSLIALSRSTAARQFAVDMSVGHRFKFEVSAIDDDHNDADDAAVESCVPIGAVCSCNPADGRCSRQRRSHSPDRRGGRPYVVGKRLG